jgi:hypothetical protein
MLALSPSDDRSERRIAGEDVVDWRCLPHHRSCARRTSLRSIADSDQRRAIENAIWMCNNRSRSIDSDVVRFTVERLRVLKAAHEAAIRAEIEELATPPDRGSAPCSASRRRTLDTVRGRTRILGGA